jgi:hypothetical protein
VSYPKNFNSAAHFAEYILECAERDREAFLDALTCYGTLYTIEENQPVIKETKAELHEIRKRLTALRERNRR